MHAFSKYVFCSTLILYVLTLLTVTYVGVYLTYVAVPVIVLSGLLMKLSAKRNNPPGPVSTAVANVLSGANTGLAQVNESLLWYNEKLRIINEKTEPHNKRIQDIKIKMIEPEVMLKYERDPFKIKALEAQLESMEQDISEIESQKDEIKLAVEIDIARRRQQGQRLNGPSAP
ncbi:hypothetical protein [Erwinia sp. S38]|uniref:hypothetical protein n=1 Tax=Erwinia sp. S38 TaxID=2769338 RepID=UPI00190A2881|nr:hypothetical protein [Erwinia sp. S38]MBK0003310.1 hypothetical protein [Erwinia sp. S38]